MKYFIYTIISFFIVMANVIAIPSQFKSLGTFTVKEFVTPKHSIKHTANFARTSGQQYCFMIKTNNHVFSNNIASYSEENQYTTVVVSLKQIYQLYHSAIKAKYWQRIFLVRFKKYLYYTYGDNDGGTLGLAIKPVKLKTVVILILNGQEYQFDLTNFNRFIKIIKVVAEQYGPVSVNYESPILGHLK